MASSTTLVVGLLAFPWVPLGATPSDNWEVLALKVLPAVFGTAATAWHVRSMRR